MSLTSNLSDKIGHDVAYRLHYGEQREREYDERKKWHEEQKKKLRPTLSTAYTVLK